MAMQRSLTTLAGAALLNSCFGTLHAFSVLLAPWEQSLRASRGSVSLIYSVAILFTTIAVLFSHRLFAHLRPAPLALVLGVTAAAGLTIAAFATNVPTALLGYGVIFGLADGFGYALAIERAAASWPARKGLAIGIVTAAYAAGAMLASPLLAQAATVGGARAALLWLAVTLLCVCFFAAALFWTARVASTASASSEVGSRPVLGQTQHLLWISYLFGATAGLMAIGHAAGIMSASGGQTGEAALGATIIALGNGIGSLAGGWLTDRWSPRPVLIATALLSAISVLFLAAGPAPPAALVALTNIGLAYGALITVYPVAATIYFGPVSGPRAFGRVFTAWGVAGLAGPWLAGLLFDLTQGYAIALIVAAIAAILCGAVAAALPK